MKSYQLEIERRVEAKGRHGEDLCLVNGDEPEEKLKDMIFDLARHCPVSRGNDNCPFYKMASLSETALLNLISSLSRQACLDLFDKELICRINHKMECFSRMLPQSPPGSAGFPVRSKTLPSPRVP
jgi:hypothetical protein